MRISLLSPRPNCAGILRAVVSFTSVASIAMFGAMFGIARLAHAQGATVSDADRAAARELATQGIQLQEAGNFGEALDRFDRAQAVFSAPTHLLHIAECEAALGKLVESAETYRTLVRTPLPTGAPPAFVQAQQQGATELAQVEPRIPSIRVLVRPRVIPNTTLQIDGQAVSAALVGVQRPTDPGPHTVLLLAPGYARAEQRIVLAEKETKDVAFNLGGAAGYAPPAAATTATPPPATTPPPSPPPAQPYGTQPYGVQPYPYGAQPYAPPPPPPEPATARGGFMLGVSVGALIPAGGLSSQATLSNYVSGGAALGLAGGFRFVRKLYLGLAYEHGVLGVGNSLNSTGGQGGTASTDSNYIGLEFAFLSNPDGTASFFAKVGAGYRWVDFSAQPPAGQPGGFSSTYGGGEGSLGVGVEINIARWVRLVPQLTISAGQFSSASSSGDLPGGIENGSIADTDAHVFVLFGLAGFVDFSRKH